MEIYLDHAATTYVDERVKESMDKYFSDEYGNPGSFNTVGLRAKNAMDESRETISKILNCTPQEIIFTGSGTESINLAIKGFVRANKSKGNHIITQKTEHEAVLETCHYLEKEEGLKVTYLDVDEFGLIKLDELEKEIYSYRKQKNEGTEEIPSEPLSPVHSSEGVKKGKEAIWDADAP